MLKLIVIGPRADILPFKAIGAELMDAQDGSAASEALESLRDAEEQLLVMMTEEIANQAGPAIVTFRKQKKNIFLPIPSITTPVGSRIEQIRAMVARSLGVDLLGQNTAAGSE